MVRWSGDSTIPCECVSGIMADNCGNISIEKKETEEKMIRENEK
jgi:hypothetical protein